MYTLPPGPLPPPTGPTGPLPPQSSSLSTLVEYHFGTPLPDPSWTPDTAYPIITEGIDTADMGDFGFVDTGGMSASKMFIVWTRFERAGALTCWVQHQWLRPDGGVIYTQRYQPGECRGWLRLYTMLDRSQVSSPGVYRCRVTADGLSASVDFDFNVTAAEAVYAGTPTLIQPDPLPFITEYWPRGDKQPLITVPITNAGGTGIGLEARLTIPGGETYPAFGALTAGQQTNRAPESGFIWPPIPGDYPIELTLFWWPLYAPNNRRILFSGALGTVRVRDFGER